MVRLNQKWDEASLLVVSPGVVLAHAADAVAEAVARRWPGESVSVGPQLPSVTNYVTNVAVGEARFVAKYSVLGVSLVSIVRGVCGPWTAVETTQRDYVRDPHSQLLRERTQLRLLNAYTRRDNTPFRVPQVITYEAGVLITAAVDGSTLATEILREHVQADKLLSSVVQAVNGLHRDIILMRLVPAAALDRPHTSISGTFARKFLGPVGGAYRDSLGIGWVGPNAQRELAATFTTVCEMLAPLPRSRSGSAVIYGDLKPEHIVLDQTGRQTWLDPGLQRCDSCADVAKLMLRTALALIVAQPSRARVVAITEALEALAAEQPVGRSRTARADTQRRLLTLWVADWANYLATGLSVPPVSGLPLPPALLDAAARAESLLQIAHATATALFRDPALAWEIMLSGIHQLAAGPR